MRSRGGSVMLVAVFRVSRTRSTGTVSSEGTVLKAPAIPAALQLTALQS